PRVGGGTEPATTSNAASGPRRRTRRIFWGRGGIIAWFVVVRDPLRDVAAHVVGAHWRAPTGQLPRWDRRTGATAGTADRQVRALARRRRGAPRVAFTEGASSRPFPLGLGGEALVQVCTIISSLVPSDAVDGMILAAGCTEIVGALIAVPGVGG